MIRNHFPLLGGYEIWLVASPVVWSVRPTLAVCTEAGRSRGVTSSYWLLVGLELRFGRQSPSAWCQVNGRERDRHRSFNCGWSTVRDAGDTAHAAVLRALDAMLCKVYASAVPNRPGDRPSMWSLDSRTAMLETIWGNRNRTAKASPPVRKLAKRLHGDLKGLDWAASYVGLAVACR